MGTTGAEELLRDAVDLVLLSKQDHGAASDVMGGFSQSDGFHAEGKHEGLNHSSGGVLEREAGVGGSGDLGVVFEVAHEQGFGVVLLLLRVQLDHLQLLLIEARVGVPALVAGREEVLSEESGELVLATHAYIVDAVLVNDGPGDAIHETHCQH